MTNWNSTRWGWVCAAIAGVVASLSLLDKIAEQVSLPARMRAVEATSKSLEHGQQELTRRVDLMGADIQRLVKDVDANSQRLERSLSDISSKLSGIDGKIEGVRTKGEANESAIAALKEKSINALQRSDEAYGIAVEAMAKGTK